MKTSLLPYNLTVWRKLSHLIHLMVDQLEHAAQLFVKYGSNVVAEVCQPRSQRKSMWRKPETGRKQRDAIELGSHAAESQRSHSLCDHQTPTANASMRETDAIRNARDIDSLQGLTVAHFAPKVLLMGPEILPGHGPHNFLAFLR